MSTPRLCPSQVIEHRISFGTYERNQLNTLAKAYRSDKVLENVPNMMLGTAGIMAAVGIPILGYQIGLALANAIPFDNGAIAEKYEEMVQNKILRPLKGLEPIDPTYQGGELRVASYDVGPRGVITYSVPRWATIVGVGWVYAQYVRGRGKYRSYSSAMLNWLQEHPEEHAAAVANGYATPPGTYTAPIGPGLGGPGDFDGDGIPDEYDPSHYS